MKTRWYDFFFFFSSRRRHTRLTCDWSSDVCSSDLFDSQSDTGTHSLNHCCRNLFLSGQGLLNNWGLQFRSWPLRSPRGSGLPVGQGGSREPSSSDQSQFGSQRNRSPERREEYLPAVPPWCGPLLSRDRHEDSGFAGSHKLIGPSRERLIDAREDRTMRMGS